MEYFESRRSRYVVSLVLRYWGSHWKFQEFRYDNVSFSMTSLLSPIVVRGCQTKHDSFARNSPISTVLSVECFLELILLIYRFKMINFRLKTAHLSPQHVNNMAPNLIRDLWMMLWRHTSRGEWVSSLAIYATRMDFDWPAFCWRQSKQYIPTRRGVRLMNKLMCRFVATRKKKSSRF